MTPAPPSRVPATTVDEVLDLYRRWGNRTYDEEVSQLDHALQTAALAAASDASDALIVAALLHDVGHLLDLEAAEAALAADVDLGHEASGARYLASLLPPGVTAPIALHVRAKRYRCAIDADYHAALSAGSTRSLVRQGGPMSPDEVASFERLSGHADAVALREWDDGGKVDGLHVPDLDHYVDMVGGLVSR